MAITPLDKIRQLENQLEEFKREKKGLQKIISHDIRSPFNKIHALIQLMKMEEESLTKDQVEYLESMHLTIMSGLELVRNMHDIKLVEEGGVEIQKDQIDIISLVKKAINNYEELARLKGVKINFNPNITNSKILADEHYLQRAIENLISNAVKYSHEDKPINADLSEEDNIISLSVTNFSQGIKAEEAKTKARSIKELMVFKIKQSEKGNFIY